MWTWWWHRHIWPEVFGFFLFFFLKPSTRAVFPLPWFPCSGNSRLTNRADHCHHLFTRLVFSIIFSTHPLNGLVQWDSFSCSNLVSILWSSKPYVLEKVKDLIKFWMISGTGRLSTGRCTHSILLTLVQYQLVQAPTAFTSHHEGMCPAHLLCLMLFCHSNRKARKTGRKLESSPHYKGGYRPAPANNEVVSQKSKT